MELNSSNMRRILTIISFAVLLFLAVQNIAAVASTFFWLLRIVQPLLVGAAIAFILDVPMSAIERGLFGQPWKRWDRLRQRGARGLSLALTLLIIIVIIVTVFILVIPEIGRSIATLAERLPGFVTEAQNWLTGLTRDIPALGEAISGSELDLSKLGGNITSWLTETSGTIATMALSFTQQLLGMIFNLFISLIFAIYILLRKERLGEQMRGLLYATLPEARADRLVSLASLTSHSFTNFLTGQVLEAFILGVLIFVTNVLFRFPYALMISVLIGILALIPIFGAIIGAGIGALLVLIESPMLALGFIVVNIVVQQFESNVIYPRTVGRSVGLPAMWVLAATLIGGAVAGVAGILLAIPLFSVAYVLASHAVGDRLRARRVPHYKIDR